MLNVVPPGQSKLPEGASKFFQFLFIGVLSGNFSCSFHMFDETASRDGVLGGVIEQGQVGGPLDAVMRGEGSLQVGLIGLVCHSALLLGSVDEGLGFSLWVGLS